MESEPGERDLSDPEERRRLLAALRGDVRANDDARRLVVSALATSAVMIVIYRTSAADWMRVPVAYCIPFLLLYLLLLAALLYLRGRAIVPKHLFIAGVLLTAGGVVLDMGMTAYKTPTLALEANPVARALLDSHHSLIFVYWYAIVTQGLLITFVCLLWGAFLKHRLTLLLSARKGKPRGRLAFVKAAMGGGELTWRQFLFPVRRSELPTAYHVAWVLMAVLMGTGPFRLYLGLCWLGFGSFGHEVWAGVLAIALSTVTYILWLTVEANKVQVPVEGVER